MAQCTHTHTHTQNVIGWHLQCAGGALWLADGPQWWPFEEWQAGITIERRQCWTSITRGCHFAFSTRLMAIVRRYAATGHWHEDSSLLLAPLPLFFIYLPPLICLMLRTPPPSTASSSRTQPPSPSPPVSLCPRFPWWTYMPLEQSYFEGGQMKISTDSADLYKKKKKNHYVGWGNRWEKRTYHFLQRSLFLA